MLWVGDWIIMFGVGVDGDVIDIMLYMVKVCNFDCIIVIIFIWKLIFESY